MEMHGTRLRPKHLAPHRLPLRSSAPAVSAGVEPASGSAPDTFSIPRRQIERGFAFDVLLRLEASSGVSLALLVLVIGIPERTLARRRTC